MTQPAASSAPHDPRVHADLPQLRALAQGARHLSLLPRQPSHSVLNGRHASKLRGRGLNFEELRDYQTGDDIRSIDWKVTARTGTPHVRVYTEERDRPALLLVDQRMSMFFGSRVYMKSVVAAEAAAISAHRLLAQGDRVGGLVFGGDSIAEHRPVRSHAALTRLLASIAGANARLHAEARDTGGQDTLNRVLQAATRIAKTNYLVLVFSDFDGVTADTEPLLRALAMNNDLLLFSVSDPLAGTLPDRFRLTASDGQLQAEFDSAQERTRERLSAAMRDRLRDVSDWARRYGAPFLSLSTDAPALGQMLQLFGHRGGR
ncbi:DUF58 domain-containing protein [Sedimentitalea sp. JM2-8]|uniref:DUF58 domain-containing protein n=1 Tax=Sedimentitalea xiamensis TaxID=3050037 RepID=A0ABT7FF79_9RHOB|nr:DUF58 domain-containing protein [Sedimentitalea xiamensis]MDK3073763.1 DUF58 domain-containing protein [Sedimentitalea xiamensis]